MSDTKFGPDRFSCFDVYWMNWIQTNKQTHRQTSQEKNTLTVEICKHERLADRITRTGSPWSVTNIPG